MTALSAIQPAATQDVRPLQSALLNMPGSLLPCGVFLFGGYAHQSLKPTDWSLKPLQSAEDATEYSGRAAQIAEMMKSLGVRNLYAPLPDFGGQIIRPSDLPTKIPLGGDLSLWRGAPADGIMIPREGAFALSSGGCPLLLATDGSRLVAAHAALYSLTRWDQPGYVSVVQRIRGCFIRPSDVKVWSFYSIRPIDYLHSVTDPQFAEGSKKILNGLREAGYKSCIVKDGGIDLPTLIRMRVDEAGMQMQIRHKDTYLHPRAFHTRCPTPEPFQSYRNLAVVVNGYRGP